MTRAERLDVARLVSELEALDRVEAAARRRGARLKDLDKVLEVFAAAKAAKLELIRIRIGLPRSPAFEPAALSGPLPAHG